MLPLASKNIPEVINVDGSDEGEEEHSESPQILAAEEGQWSSRAQGVKLLTQPWKS